MVKANIVTFLGINSKYIFLYFFLLIIYEFIPAIELSKDSGFAKFYNSAYKQQNFNTFHFEFTKLLAYLTAILIGYMMKNHTEYKNERKNILIGKSGGYKEISILLIYSLISFFIAGNSVLTGSYDFEGFCDAEGMKIVNFHRNDGEIGFKVYSSMCDIKRIYSLKFLENFFNFHNFSELNKINGVISCVNPGIFERMILNYFFFFIPFAVGVHTTYILETFPSLAYIELNLHKLKTWSKMVLITLSCAILFILLNIIFYLLNYSRDSTAKLFIFIFIVGVMLGVAITYTSQLLSSENNRIYVQSSTHDSQTTKTQNNTSYKLPQLNFSVFLLVFIPFVNIHCVYSSLLLGWMNGILIGDICKNGFRNLKFETPEKQVSNTYQEVNFISRMINREVEMKVVEHTSNS